MLQVENCCKFELQPGWTCSGISRGKHYMPGHRKINFTSDSKTQRI